MEILTPVDFEMNKIRAMYLITILNFNSFRYGYGRKRAQIRLKSEKLRLPITSAGNIDWDFIEGFIKSLPYSANLLNY